MNRIKLINADVLEGLKILATESVHCIVTSPPYWGLRDYGLEPTIWPGLEYRPLEWCEPVRIPGSLGCEHEWGEGQSKKMSGGNPQLEGGHRNTLEGYRGLAHEGQFCRRCGAWRGTLGLEPIIAMYVGHLVLVFRELRRVLRDDGTLWLNLGDSYSGSGGAGGDYNPGGLREGQPTYVGTSSLNRKLKTENRKRSL